MILIKRIITVALSVIGSLTAIILLALINSLANTGLTGAQVVLYGLISGVALGVFAGYMLINYIIRRTRKFVINKFAGSLGKFGFLRRM